MIQRKEWKTSKYIRDETSTKDRTMATAHSSSLNNNTDDEYGGGNQNTIFSSKSLSHKSRKEGTNPSTQFQDRCQPPFLRLVFEEVIVVVSHMSLERWHSQYTREDSLVVTCNNGSGGVKLGT
jgi:hypothetical protein